MIVNTDEKRVRRMKRSKALQFDCKGIHSPCVQWADTPEDLKQAFTLVHDEYLKLGYIREPDPSGMFFGIHNLLPETVSLVVKSDGKVVATLTQVADSTEYGLPMDRIYSRELNQLRHKGRKLAELCSLVTSKQLRWKNLYMQMSRIMYTHALCNGVDDFCIMVNPKHVPFYKLIFLFEELGPEKHYPTLGVPAVALRADLNRMKARLDNKYGALDRECNLFHYMHGGKDSGYEFPWANDLLPPRGMPSEMMSFFGMAYDSASNGWAVAAAVGA